MPFGHLDVSAGPASDTITVNDSKHDEQPPSRSHDADAPSATASLPLCVDRPDADADQKKDPIFEDSLVETNVGALNAEPDVADHENDTGVAVDAGACFGVGGDQHMLVDAAANVGLHIAAPGPDDRVPWHGANGDHDSVGDHGGDHIVNDIVNDDGQRCVKERDIIDATSDGRRIKRQRVETAMAEEKNDKSCTPLEKEPAIWRRDGSATACLQASTCGTDPAPEPAETRDMHHADRPHGKEPLRDPRRHTDATRKEMAIEKGGNKRTKEATDDDDDGNCNDNAASPRTATPTKTSTQKHDTAALASPVCLVYSAPPPDERRAKHRRRSAGASVQVSPCGRVIDRPVPRETVLMGPWSLPPQADVDWAGGGSSGNGSDTNPTRTAVRFWLTRPVESVRVIGAPCEFCLAIGGALVEPHSQGGVLEMGDVCDTECRPSRMPAGVAGDRLDRALRAVRRARVNGQAIAPGVLDLGGVETALVFRGPLDRDTLDHMAVRFAAYNVWRECRSADGKTITDGRWLYGS